MKGQVIIATKDTPGCAFEEWNKERHAMAPCGHSSVCQIGNNYFCAEHMADALMRCGKLDMHDVPRPGKKVGYEIFSKEDFMKIATRKK
jgi:hypothetical protein